MVTSPFSESFPPGTLIFGEGEPGTVAYIIETGCVEISSLHGGKRVVLAQLGPGELFGEMALIDEQVRSATARAIEPTVVSTISREQVSQRIANAEPLVVLFLRVILERLRRSNALAVSHLHDPSLESLIVQSSDESMGSVRDRAIGVLTLERELREGLGAGQFQVFYQPIFSVESLQLAGFEALIRWRHPTRGLVSPVVFIDIAERCGLILPLGFWALKEACAALPRLQAGAGGLPLFMSVNLSARQVTAPGLVAEVAQAIETAGIEPACLKLEVTESVLMENPEIATSALLELKSLGVSIAVDDFGTGYSSLSYLHRFPIDVLKIDRSFVNNMLLDAQSLRIVRAVSRLAKELGLKIVAEGIERPEELRLVSEFGCDYLQGYLLSPPKPSDELFPLLGSIATPRPDAEKTCPQ